LANQKSNFIDSNLSPPILYETQKFQQHHPQTTFPSTIRKFQAHLSQQAMDTTTGENSNFHNAHKAQKNSQYRDLLETQHQNLLHLNYLKTNYWSLSNF
jgi:hypothetical protein